MLSLMLGPLHKAIICHLSWQFLPPFFTSLTHEKCEKPTSFPNNIEQKVENSKERENASHVVLNQLL